MGTETIRGDEVGELKGYSEHRMRRRHDRREETGIPPQTLENPKSSVFVASDASSTEHCCIVNKEILREGKHHCMRQVRDPRGGPRGGLGAELMAVN